MSFKQLFEHLTVYVENPEWRWRHCVRVKRGLLNPNDIGGYGKDQCYFEGWYCFVALRLFFFCSSSFLYPLYGIALLLKDNYFFVVGHFYATTTNLGM